MLTQEDQKVPTVVPTDRVQTVIDLVTQPATDVETLIDKLLQSVNWSSLALVPEATQKMLQEVIAIRPQTQMGMSKFQIQRLLLNDVEYPTPTSKYWQCARELSVRLNELVRQDFQYKRALLDLEDKIEASVTIQNVRGHQRALLNLEEHVFGLVNSQLQIAETVRESHAFYESMCAIRDNADSQTREELKHWELGELRKWYAKGTVNESGVRVYGNPQE